MPMHNRVMSKSHPSTTRMTPRCAGGTGGDTRGRTTVTSKALTLFAPNDCIPEFAHPNDTVGTPKLRPVNNGHHHVIVTAPESHPAPHSVRPRTHSGHPCTPPAPLAPPAPTQCQATPQVHLARPRVVPGVSRFAPAGVSRVAPAPGSTKANPGTPCGRPSHGIARLRPGRNCRATS
jgi:hypothetical protein